MYTQAKIVLCPFEEPALIPFFAEYHKGGPENQGDVSGWFAQTNDCGQRRCWFWKSPFLFPRLHRFYQRSSWGEGKGFGALHCWYLSKSNCESSLYPYCFESDLIAYKNFLSGRCYSLSLDFQTPLKCFATLLRDAPVCNSGYWVCNCKNA